MSRYGAGSYREIREVLSPEYRDLPDASIEAIVVASLGEVEPEDVENFLKGLKKFGQSVAKLAPTVLPIAGTAVGTIFGGPLGATLGGSLGQVAGGAIHGAAAGHSLKRIGKSAAGSLIRQGAQLIPGGAGSLVPGLGAAGGSPAAAQLLGILNRPEILKSLMAMAVGRAGSSHVPVGGSPVPIGAIANLIGTLANQAEADYNAALAGGGESVPSYLLDESGEFRVDPAVPEQRAQLVLEMLLRASESEPESEPESNESDDGWRVALYEYDPDDQEDQELSDEAFYEMLDEFEMSFAEDEY